MISNNEPLEKSDKNKRKTISWLDYSRPYLKREKQVMLTLFLMLILVVIILFFLRQFSLIAALMSAFFVYWVLNMVQPRQVEYRLDEEGVWLDNHLYSWSKLKYYWVEEKDDYKLIFIRQLRNLTGFVILTIQKNSQVSQPVLDYLSQKLRYYKPAPTVVDKILNFLNKHINLNQVQEETN